MHRNRSASFAVHRPNGANVPRKLAPAARGGSGRTATGQAATARTTLVLSRSLGTFQRKKIRNDIRAFVGIQCVLVRGHRRSLDDGVLAEVGFDQRDEMLLLVDDLDRVAVFVEPPAADGFSVARYGAYKTIRRLDGSVGVQQRSFEDLRSAAAADVAQVGTDARSFAVDAMTRDALAFCLEDGLSAERLAHLYCVRAELAHVAQIGDDHVELRRVKLKWRHGRARDAGVISLRRSSSDDARENFPLRKSTL